MALVDTYEQIFLDHFDLSTTINAWTSSDR